jgi:protein tyrosine kinase modulator
MSELSPQPEQLLEEIQIGKYLEILKRRKMWIILTTTAFFCVTLVAVLRMPDVYHAETVILVDPQKVPDSVVASSVTTTLADRLSTVRQEIMSPSRLKQMLNETGLYAAERANGKEDKVILRVQKYIQLEVVDSGGSRAIAFKIGYTDSTAEAAALIPNKLAKMVIQSKVQGSQAQSENIAEFIDAQLQETKKQLEDKEAEMGRIKSTYIMDLPESKQFHLEALTGLRAQLQNSQDRISRAQQDKLYLQSMMGATNPTVDLDSDSPGAINSPGQAQAQRLEARIAELRGRYGAGHPDVRKAQSELDKLRAKIAEEQKNAAPQTPAEAPKLTKRTTRNPVIEAQLSKLDQEIEEQTKLQQQLQSQVAFHSSKLEREPIFEQQLSGLMRDYDTLRAHYNHLLDKKLSTDMYTALVSRQESEHFTILDQARIPVKPLGPNRFLYCLTAFLGGLLAGIALAIVTEMSDQSVHDEAEAANILGKAVIAGIPLIVTENQARGLRMRAVGYWGLTVASASALGLLVSVLMRRLA